jgi:hypothetical protein
LAVHRNLQLATLAHTIAVPSQFNRVIVPKDNPQIFTHPAQRSIGHIISVLCKDFEDFL